MTSAIVRRLSCGIFFASFLTLPGQSNAQSFAAGDIAVVVIGDGSTVLSSAASKVSLKEYKPSGGSGVVSTITLPNGASAPNSGNRYLTMSGTAISEGQLSISGNKLVLGGFNATNGTTSVAGTASASVNRTVGLVDFSDGTIDTTTALSNAYSTGDIRGAALAGTTVYTVGSNNGQYSATVGTSGNATLYSSTIASSRHIESYNGQLYFSCFSGSTVGISMLNGPGNASTPLFSTGSTASPYDFAFASASIVYIADDRVAASGGGIQKWVNNGVSWSLAYTMAVGGTGAARGLTVAQDDHGNNVLWATTGETTNNRLVRLTDLGNLADSNATLALQASAGANLVFRGVRHLGDTTFTSVPSPSALLPFLMGAPTLIVKLRRRK